jgi:hypothetical protein
MAFTTGRFSKASGNPRELLQMTSVVPYPLHLTTFIVIGARFEGRIPRRKDMLPSVPHTRILVHVQLSYFARFVTGSKGSCFEK